MGLCRCPACSDDPLPTHTPEYRLQCEARELLRWPLKARQEYLQAKAVSERRAELEAEMTRQWESARQENRRKR